MRHTLLMKQLSLQYCLSAIKGVRKRGGWGYPPLELDILQKLYYMGSA